MKTTLVAVKIILIIVITVSIGSVLGAIGYVASIKNNPPIAVVQPTIMPTITQILTPTVTSTQTPTVTPNIDISDWKTYKNEKYGFEFKHPSAFTTKEKLDKQSNLQEVDLIGLEGNFNIFITDSKNIFFDNPKAGGKFRYEVGTNQWVSVSEGEDTNIMCQQLRYVISGNVPSYHFGNLMVDGYPRLDLIVTNKGYGFEIWRDVSVSGNKNTDVNNNGWELQEKIVGTISLIGDTKQKEVSPCIGFKVVD